MVVKMVTFVCRKYRSPPVYLFGFHSGRWSHTSCRTRRTSPVLPVIKRPALFVILQDVAAYQIRLGGRPSRLHRGLEDLYSSCSTCSGCGQCCPARGTLLRRTVPTFVCAHSPQCLRLLAWPLLLQLWYRWSRWRPQANSLSNVTDSVFSIINMSRTSRRAPPVP